MDKQELILKEAAFSATVTEPCTTAHDSERLNRIESLRSSIASGTYEISSMQVADSLMRAMLEG